MLQAEYVKDMHNNYIVLKGIEGKVSAYGTKMLLNNTIKGLLKTELRCIDHMDLFYYDITSKKSIVAICDNKSLTYIELKKILSQIIGIIENSGEYLLSENDFIIEPNYVYVDNTTLDIELCHLVGQEDNIQEQLSKFMEYLMNKVDYKDEAAVVLIYAMYKESKEPDCTFDKLVNELNIKSNEPKVKKVIVVNENYNEKTKNVKASEKIYDSKVNGSTNTNGIQKNRVNNNDYINKNKKNTLMQGTQNEKWQSNILNKQINNNQKSQKDKLQNKNSNHKKSKKLKFQDQKSQNSKPQNKNLQNQKIGSQKLQNHFSGNQNIESLPMKGQFQFNDLIDKLLGTNNRSVDKTWSASMVEEVESERENYYFGSKTYIFAGVSLLVGIITFITALQLKLLHNSFGTRIDITKFLCCILILGCMEAYIFIKLFDPKNKLIEIKTDVEYIESSQDNNEINYNAINKDEIKNSDINQDETRLLWTNPNDSDQDKTVILSQILPHKQYRLIEIDKDTNKEIIVNQFPFIVGKFNKGVNLIIDDTSVSRCHAKFTREGEDIFLTDLNSTNGTFINGIKLTENKPYLITEKDEISFSQVKYTWEASMQSI